jgi:hypothetical protein
MLIIFSDLLDHFFICFNNKSPYISTFFAVVDCTCKSAGFIIYVCAATDRAYLNKLFQAQDRFLLDLQYPIVNYI